MQETEASARAGAERSDINRALAQYYVAEYAAMMARISAWERLQYATVPLLAAALSFVMKIEQIWIDARWWLALVISLMVYVAYQGTMVNMLHNVLLIERDVRPRARTLVDTDSFWVHERIWRRSLQPRVAWSPYWPPIGAVGISVAGAWFIIAAYGFKCWYVVFGLITVGLLAMVMQWTAKGKQLSDEITRACNMKDDLASPTK